MPARFTISIVAAFIVVACDAESWSPTFPTGVRQPQCGSVAWSADHETADLSQWYVGGGGAESNSGNAISVASTDVAHSGRYSAKGTITAPPVAGVRLSRWKEGPATPESLYSAWYYFPRIYTANGFWNIFQFKSRDCNSGCPSATTDPFWYLNVGKRPNGAMYLFLSWWGELWTLRGLEGPHQGERGYHAYQQTLKDLPVGQWVHIEAYLRQSSGFDGQIIVWQDGVEIFNQNNVRTRYPFEGNRWSISNYSDSISPSPATIYFDDAVITACIGSRSAGAMSPAEP
jgi:hypothetical protein